MGKILERQIVESDILTFLEKDDNYSFELKIIQLINNFPDISVTHGGIYFDTDLKHNRQYDIQAQLPVEDDLYIKMAIECKSISENFPLIVKTSPRLRAESYIHLWQFVRITKTSFEDGKLVSSYFVGNKIEDKKILNPSFYPLGEATGRSCFQLGYHVDSNKGFECNESECYDKWTQALSSLKAMMNDVSKLFLWQEKNKGFVHGRYLFLPILVVPDRSLWTVAYSSEGPQGIPQRVERIPFFVDREYLLTGTQNEKIEYNVSHLEIMTQTGLVEFINKCSVYEKIILGVDSKHK